MPHGHTAGRRIAKHSREWTSTERGYGPQTVPYTADPSTAIKRSFQTACRRAVEHGSTQYRGITLRPQHLSQAQVQKALSSIHAKGRQPIQASVPKPPFHSGRLQVMVWNSGGLAYHDLMHWLEVSPRSPDVIIILETRLAHHMEHLTTSYYLMHSIAPSRMLAF